MPDEAPRSRAARAAAEQALVRVVHHYGSRPEFVLLGGLVPELLCSGSQFQHAGTTDVDVQVNLEIACGMVNTVRLETALLRAEFLPGGEHVWRWVADGIGGNTVVKFELLADLDDAPAHTTIKFDNCKDLGAINLRGTQFASRDVQVRSLAAKIDGVDREVEINVTGLAGYLLAKAAAAHSRRKPKDWYDLAFVLLHNDRGGPEAAAQEVVRRFGAEIRGAIKTSLDDLKANFGTRESQGPEAYRTQMLLDRPDLDATTVEADALVAVDVFYRALFTQ